MKQVSKNIILNITYQILIYILPLITVPYVSRVLGVNNIGVYSYTYSIVYYFMILGMLGINNYGSRKIAKSDSIKEKTINFIEIYRIQFILSITMIIIYMLYIGLFSVKYKIIMLIQGINIISVAFDINWFFFGMEKFKLTVIRNIIVKFLTLILIFLFVKTSGDLWIYTLIMSLGTLASQLYLWTTLKKYIKYEKIKFKESLKHIKKIVILFIPVIAYSIYKVMDKTMIGVISGTTELGYYENAEKIINIPISIITALGTVMIPYMSKNEKNDQFSKKILYALNIGLLLIIPMFFGLLVVGQDFAIIYFGNSFAKSGILIEILAITIIFVCLANVIRTTYLIPKEKDNIYVVSTIIGAIINLVTNFIFIPKYGSIGACFGTIVAEFFVCFYQFMKVRKEENFETKKYATTLIKYMTKGFLLYALLILINNYINPGINRLIVDIAVAMSFWLIINTTQLKQIIRK